jgi:hypothetical protein
VNGDQVASPVGDRLRHRADLEEEDALPREAPALLVAVFVFAYFREVEAAKIELIEHLQRRGHAQPPVVASAAGPDVRAPRVRDDQLVGRARRVGACPQRVDRLRRAVGIEIRKRGDLGESSRAGAAKLDEAAAGSTDREVHDAVAVEVACGQVASVLPRVERCRRAEDSPLVGKIITMLS